MKTPMQILFDNLKESVKDEEHVIAYGSEYHPNDVKQANLIISCVYNILNKIEPLIILEKQELIKAFELGNDLGHKGRLPSGDGFYNDKYKNVSK